jgi:hypothetical protein
MNLDAFAKDAAEWRESGYHRYRASKLLFEGGDPFLWFSAATLGHHALEMLLKAVLIHAGMTVCDPKKVNRLDPALRLTEDDCAWGHDLITLAEKLAAKRTDFNLAAQICCFLVCEKTPISLRRGFEIFDPFFTELRYPHQAEEVGDLGECHGELLGHLFGHLEPFLDEIPPPTKVTFWPSPIDRPALPVRPSS